MFVYTFIRFCYIEHDCSMLFFLTKSNIILNETICSIKMVIYKVISMVRHNNGISIKKWMLFSEHNDAHFVLVFCFLLCLLVIWCWVSPEVGDQFIHVDLFSLNFVIDQFNGRTISFVISIIETTYSPDLYINTWKFI